MKKYHYTECGLNNVYLANGYEIYEFEGEECVAIHDQEGLHKAIGCDLLNKTSLLKGDEIRFLRKEIGVSQKELAQVLGNTDQTLANWEKDKRPHTQAEDLVIRMYYASKIEISKELQEYLSRLALDEMERMDRTFQEDQDQWEPAECA